MIRLSTLNGTGGIATNGFFTIGGIANGLNSPFGLALTTTDLYIANFNTGNVFRYSLASGLQTNTLSLSNINGGYSPNPYGLAIKDDTLWVSQATTGVGAGTIKGFSLNNFNGIPTHTISTVTLPLGLAVEGNILYAVDSPSAPGASGSIKTFDATSGLPIATLVSGLTQPQGVTIYGNNLYVTGGDGTVKGFDATTGAVLAGFTTITGLSSPYGIVVTPQSVGTLTIGMYAGLTVTGTVGAPYTIEYTTSLTPPIVWTPLSTGTLMTSPFLYIDTSIVAGSRFYRATF
jgi:WD40 repeat protein